MLINDDTVLVIVTDLRRIFRALVAHQSPSVSRMMTGEHHWLGHQPGKDKQEIICSTGT